jgi:hypothetical protein
MQKWVVRGAVHQQTIKPADFNHLVRSAVDWALVKDPLRAANLRWDKGTYLTAEQFVQVSSCCHSLCDQLSAGLCCAGQAAGQWGFSDLQQPAYAQLHMRRRHCLRAYAMHGSIQQPSRVEPRRGR